MDIKEEKELIKRARREPEAFGAIFEEYYGPIFGYVLKRVGNVHEAQDIVSETFFKALDRLWQFRWRDISISNWLYRYFEDKKIAEIAEILGKREGTIKSLLSRGLVKLKLVISDIFKSMTLGKTSTALAAVTVFALVIAAGIFGPSASEIAEAEATDTIKRAFARITDLSDTERAELEQKFQSSLTESLAEAQAAADLEVVNADEMPMPGFVGREVASCGSR